MRILSLQILTFDQLQINQPDGVFPVDRKANDRIKRDFPPVVTRLLRVSNRYHFVRCTVNVS